MEISPSAVVIEVILFLVYEASGNLMEKRFLSIVILLKQSSLSLSLFLSICALFFPHAFLEGAKTRRKRVCSPI
jgi:hypothetical protein